MGVDKEELFTTYPNIQRQKEFTSCSTFKAELLSHCSSTVVYDIPYCSSESLLLSRVKTSFQMLLPNPGGESHVFSESARSDAVGMTKDFLFKWVN